MEMKIYFIVLISTEIFLISLSTRMNGMFLMTYQHCDFFLISSLVIDLF
jgi:hypothetical protein